MTLDLPGILPISQSTFSEKGFLTTKNNKTLGGFDGRFKVARAKNKKWDVLYSELVHEEGAVVVEAGFSQVAVKSGWNESLPVLADFPLVGSGEKYDSCGLWFTVGCLNGEGHQGMNLDGVNMNGKAYLEKHVQSCHRALCPVCWEYWANREKDNASKRIHSFHLEGRNLQPIHLIVGVPSFDFGLSLQELRKKVYKSLKEVHCLGGMMIFHPRRKNAFSGEWYFSPHFHVLGFGWILDVRRNYFKSGYVVKNVGIRKSLEGTIWYQLSHAGVPDKKHGISWFGCLSYNKLHVKKEEEKEHLCPICGEFLRKVVWIGKGIEPCFKDEFEGFSFFDSPDNWMYSPLLGFRGGFV